MKTILRQLTPPLIWDFARSLWKKVRLFLKIREFRLPTEGFREIELLGVKWRLDMSSCISQSMVQHGIWEPETTQIVTELVSPGMKALSVGANFGYFTLLMAKQVGPTGHVWAFEPTRKYREQLIWHVHANQLEDRVTVVPFGLSDSAAKVSIDLTSQSASIHYAPTVAREGSEEIELKPLDQVAQSLGIDSVDFITMDIDGHEESFLRGARRILTDYQPTIIMEFAQQCLYYADSDSRKVAMMLRELGYCLCSEKTRKPFADEMDFLKECGNYNAYANALALPKPSGDQTSVW